MICPAPGAELVLMSGHGAELVAYYQHMGRHVPAGTPFDANGARVGNRVEFSLNLLPTVREAATMVWSEGVDFSAAGWVYSVAAITTPDDRVAAYAEIESRRDTWHRRTWRDVGGQPLGLTARCGRGGSQHSTCHDSANDRHLGRTEKIFLKTLGPEAPSGEAVVLAQRGDCLTAR